MLGKFLERILHEEEETEDSQGFENEESDNKSHLLVSIAIFLAAFLPRIIFLFFFTDPGRVGPAWYGDVYHHWQIAILSKEIGFRVGFLKLWDFKGMEYYWGLLHPLATIVGFIISGSTSILVPRLLSVIFSSLTILLIFLIVNRFFGRLAAVLSALFVAFFPVSLFSDTLGMQEPLGLFFLLAGVYLYPKFALVSGFFWILAGMERSEYWLFGAGLLCAVILRSKNSHAKLLSSIGYFVPMLFYMKYLLNYTGNPIYPVYWNFLATVVGEWFKKDVQLSAKVQLIKLLSQVVSISSIIAWLAVFWKKPKGYLFFLIGLANIAFIFFVFGFGSYLYGYPEDGISYIVDLLFVDRLLSFPYSFLGVSLVIFVVYLIPKYLPQFLKYPSKVLGTVIVISTLLLSQILWFSINYHYAKAMAPLPEEERFAHFVSSYYKGKGTIIIPEGKPTLTYFLIHNEKIPPGSLVSQMYNPFYYYKNGDPFQNWGQFRLKFFEWFVKQNAELVVVAGDPAKLADYGNFARAIFLEENFFNLEGSKDGYSILRVKIDEMQKVLK